MFEVSKTELKLFCPLFLYFANIRISGKINMRRRV